MQKFRIFFVTFLLFVAATVLLLNTQKALEFAETKVVSAGNEVSQNESSPVLPEPKKPEIVDRQIPPPEFGSLSVLAMDLETEQMLYQKNIHKRLRPASTTKIMTALVSQEYFKHGEVLVVPKDALVGGSKMGLEPGEQLSFRSLLYGMLLNSGNDAAYTIALNFPGGLEGFVSRMNEKVGELNLSDTSFENPAGFDGPNHYSSAYDLAIIAKAAVGNPQLARVFSTKETSILSWDKTKEHNLRNLNKLLSEQGVLGVKTGFTEKAGENLVGLVERDNHKVLTAVLSSQDRFGETKQLMDWVYENYEWR